MKKRPLKRLDGMRLGDWVTESFMFLPNKIGCIYEFGVITDTGYRYARIEDTEGKKYFVGVDNIKPLDPAIANILNASFDKGSVM